MHGVINLVAADKVFTAVEKKDTEMHFILLLLNQ